MVTNTFAAVIFASLLACVVTTIGILLAISAGALVCVGASHLLPAVEKENKSYSILALAVGVLVAVVIVMSRG